MVRRQLLMGISTWSVRALLYHIAAQYSEVANNRAKFVVLETEELEPHLEHAGRFQGAV